MVIALYFYADSGDTVDTDTTYSVAAADGSSGNRKSVVMTAGGSGSGKTRLVKNILSELSDKKIIRLD